MSRTKGSKNRKISDVSAPTLSGAEVKKTETIEVGLTKSKIEDLIVREAKKSAGFSEYQAFEKQTVTYDKRGDVHVVMVNPILEKADNITATVV